jgi:hypothetical protein
MIGRMIRVGADDVATATRNSRSMIADDLRLRAESFAVNSLRTRTAEPLDRNLAAVCRSFPVYWPVKCATLSGVASTFR